eukprot:9365168-Pyramimonas_sp.AAC.1
MPPQSSAADSRSGVAVGLRAGSCQVVKLVGTLFPDRIGARRQLPSRPGRPQRGYCCHPGKHARRVPSGRPLAGHAAPIPTGSASTHQAA